MNKQLLALGAVLLGGTAHAQSTVQVYGIVDVYAQYLDGASHLGRVQSGGKEGSRLGFRGNEDLGGGMNAFFTLEMGLNADDGTLGQSGLAFGRQAFVGLSDAWGEVSLGRQYGSLYRLASEFAVFGVGLHGPSTQTIGGFSGGYQYDFSKRTAFYSSITRFNNDRNAGVGGLGRLQGAVPAGLTRVGNADVTEVVTGLRHSF